MSNGQLRSGYCSKTVTVAGSIKSSIIGYPNSNGFVSNGKLVKNIKLRDPFVIINYDNQ